MVHAHCGLARLLVAVAVSVVHVAVGIGIGIQDSAKTHSSPSVDTTVTHLFNEFITKHGRTYKFGSKEYHDRRSLFERRLGKVQQQNMKVGRLWKAGINKLADMTDIELASLRGYKRTARSGPSASSSGPAAVGFMGFGGTSDAAVLARMPGTFSWAGKLKATTNILDQGTCGSCWAFASVTTLNAHSELFADAREFSPQQIVSCAPNPRKCGGDGGCEGATVELAFDYLLQGGAVTEKDFPYEAQELVCPPHLQINGSRPRGGAHGAEAPSVDDVNVRMRDGPARTFGLTGWTPLPENKARPFFQTLYESGPIAVALATYSRWNYYESGILDSCRDELDDEAQGFIVNHAVVLIGWGQEKNAPYWQIQNSWGPDWGEKGYMRILRQVGIQEERLCAIDDDPLVGVGCPDGPSWVEVCGSCGMLYDGLIPIFDGSPNSWWSQHGHQTFQEGMPASDLEA